MIKTEKAPTREATRAEAAGVEMSGKTFSISDFSTMAADSQFRKLWDVLPVGEALAIPGNDLAALAEYRNTRALRFAVDRMRAQGVPVLASDNGYFRPAPGPTGIAEIRRFLQRQDARMASNRRTTRLIRARLKSLKNAQIDGQQEIGGI